jgi:hypothetical protein
MKASEGTKVNEAVMDEVEQDKDKVALGEDPPDASGGGSGAKDGSMEWDVTNAEVCVEQLLELFPDMALEKARSLLELAGLRRLHRRFGSVTDIQTLSG